MSKTANNPTISVIIPTYNRAHLLDKAIQSVLDQTYEDFEIIVIDDGSTDNTKEVVNSFNDDRLRYIRLEKNSGTSALPRNTGIRIAQGEYIAFQDDDSLWLPEKLERQVKAFQDAPAKVGVVYTGMWQVRDSEKIYHPPSYITETEGDIHKQILGHYFIGHPPVLVQRKCFKTVGTYDEKLPAALDWDMWLRVSKHYHFKLIDEPLVSAYYSPVTSYYDQTAWAKGFIAVLNKHFQEFKETDHRSLAERYFSYGTFLCINDDLTQFAEGRRSIQ